VVGLAQHGYFGDFEGCEVGEAEMDEFAFLVEFVAGR
jgi:hypothetical protein